MTPSEKDVRPLVIQCLIGVSDRPSQFDRLKLTETKHSFLIYFIFNVRQACVLHPTVIVM